MRGAHEAAQGPMARRASLPALLPKDGHEQRGEPFPVLLTQPAPT